MGRFVSFSDASNETQTKLKNSGYILNNIAAVPYPLYYFEEEIILTRENRIYAYDPVEYLGFHTEPFFIE